VPSDPKGPALEQSARADRDLAEGPRDLSDGRERGEWRGRYPRRAWIQVATEAIYVFVVILACPIGLYLFWKGSVQGWLGVSTSDSAFLAKEAYAWIAGVLGGSLFTAKWLYRSVARGWWNADRIVWRFLTPHISGALAFALVTFLQSGLIGFFDEDSLDEGRFIVAVAFLVGYFSDNAVSALARLARHVFGEDEAHRHASERK
jgi:hypothetical protein